ncbi:MAG: alpha-(1-2)-phosphatidylinositol mannosyltransferase [Fibrobacteres bacterium]|nr:alpha-(1-2)-phosphatidylinositol mannosyltransferase [Fibrobacterota bacterium]
MPKDRGIRALLITTDYPPDVGGLQTYSYRIARDLPGGRLAQVLAGSDHIRQALPPPAAGVGLAIRKGRSRWRAFWWSLWSVPYFRFRWGTDFLLHMQWTTAIPSMILSRLGGAHYLVLVHGAELIDPERFLVRILKRMVLSRADAVVSGSAHTAEIVAQLGIRCRRLEIIPYGNPLEGESEKFRRPTAGSDGTPRLLCMHRLVPRKGTSLLLEALAEMRSVPWTLDIVGRGEEEENLRQRVSALGLEDRIRFLAPVDEAEKIRLLGEATLFILPSLPPVSNNHVEGLGLTLLEAQSLGLPVLASRTGGIPEAIQEGLTGMLFRAGDREDLREQLIAMLASPDRLKAMGRAGPEWIRGHFSWKAGLARLGALMDEVARAR